MSRGPSEELLLQFEAVSQLAPQEQAVVREVLESLIIKYQARRWDSARNTAAATASAAAPAKKKAEPRKKERQGRRTAAQVGVVR